MAKKTGGLDRPFYAKFKKHYCAICGNKLKLTKVTHCQIEFGSPEAKKKRIRFDLFGHAVDYTFSIFGCDCGNKISINDQYFIENPHKENRSTYDDYYDYLQNFDRQNDSNEYQQYVESLERQKNSVNIKRK